MDTNRNFDIRYRLKYALDRYGWTVYKLAGSEDNALRSRLQKQIHGNTAISAETLGLILATFPDLSAEWLMRGSGNFIRADHPATQVHNHVHTEGGPAAVAAIGDVKQESADDRLQQIISLQADAIAQRDRQIQLLETMVTALRAGQKL